MPFDKACLTQQRAMIDVATNLKYFDALSKQDKDRIMAELTGKAIKNEWSADKISKMAGEFIVNGYLTAPTNPATNILSAVSQTVMVPLTREISTIIGKITDPNEKRRIGSGLYMLKSAVQNFGERMRFFNEGYTRGAPLDVRISSQGFGVTEKDFSDFAKKHGAGEAESLFLKQQLYDTYGSRHIPGTFGKVLAQGAKLGVGIDEANKAMFRRMEYEGLAFDMAPILAKREGISEAEALKKLELGEITPDNWQAKMREKLSLMGFDSPEAELIKLNRRAQQAVFQGEVGETLGKISNWRAQHPLLGALTVPFVKTPAVILNEGAAYVPVIGMLHRRAKVDPETGTFKGTAFAARIKEERSTLAAKQLLGVAATVYVNHLVDQGLLTGSNPTGDKPKYSVKLGDTWYGYGRIEPLATVVGLAVDLHETFNKYRRDPMAGQDTWEDVKKYGGLYLTAIGNNITQKSFMEGFSKMFAAAAEPGTYLGNFLQSYSTALVPAGVAAVARTVDPIEREATTFLDRVRSRTPGMREELPPKYDITGQPMERSLGEVWVGIKTKTPNAIQAALEESGYTFTPSDNKINGVSLTTEQVAEYKQLAGNYFAAMMTEIQKEPLFRTSDMSMKDLIIKNAMTDARTAATKQLTGTLYLQDKKFREAYDMQSLIKKGQADELLRQQGRQQ